MYLALIVVIYVVISYLIFKQLSYIRKFKKNNVTHSATARSLDSMGLNSSVFFKELVKKGVIEKVKSGEKFFLNFEKGTFFAKKRRGLFYTVTFFFLIIFFFVWNNF